MIFFTAVTVGFLAVLALDSYLHHKNSVGLSVREPTLRVYPVGPDKGNYFLGSNYPRDGDMWYDASTEQLWGFENDG